MRRSIQVKKRSVRKKQDESAPVDNRPEKRTAPKGRPVEEIIRLIDSLLR